MATDIENVESKVLNRMLTEIESDSNFAPDVQICVICLERVSEGASTRPCGHGNFDFLCLLSWLEQQSVCPLCKTEVAEVEYSDKDGQRRRYAVPTRPENVGAEPQASSLPSSTPLPSASYQHRFSRRHRPRRHEWRDRRNCAQESPDAVLSCRRRIYAQQLYSLHVGTNRISAYSDLSPADFNRSPALTARARSWVRRELRVFTYLGGGGSTSAPSEQDRSSSPFGSSGPTIQSASNAEFLLEYIIAILKSVDIKASTGHAEHLVAEFLGRENAKLFLHELNSWLRSPYESLEAWDSHVQYPEPPCRDESMPRNPHNQQRKRTFTESRESSHPRRSRNVKIRSQPHRRRVIDRYVPD